MALAILGGMLFALGTVLLERSMQMQIFQVNDKIALIAPYLCTFLQFALSAVGLLLLLCYKKQSREAFLVLKTQGGKIFLVGSLLGGGIGMCAYTAAVEHIGSSYATAISALFPVLGAVLAHVFLREKTGKTQLAGLAVSVLGVVALNFNNGALVSESWRVGLVLAFLCCVCWAAEAVICAYGFQKTTFPYTQALLIRQFFSTFFCAIVLFPLLDGWDATIAVLCDRTMIVIVFGATALTLSYLCYYMAITKIGATMAMSLNITYAAWTIPITWVVLSQWPTAKNTICSILVVLGSALCIRKQKKDA